MRVLYDYTAATCCCETGKNSIQDDVWGKIKNKTEWAIKKKKIVGTEFYFYFHFIRHD